MTDRALPATAILAAAIGLGFAADQLLRTSGGPGLNFSLLFAGLAVSVWIVAQSSGRLLSREASLWLGAGVLFGAALMWRGSEILRMTAFLAACTALALPALKAGGAWITRSGVLDFVEALAGAGLHGVFGSVRLLSPAHWGAVGRAASRGAVGAVVRTAIGGVLLALVPLTVFGALFVSADEVFAAIVGDLVKIDVQDFASHFGGVAALSWLAGGYLVGASSGTRLEGLRRLTAARPTLGLAQVATALALVDLLFLGFVLVQFRYLFGGGAWVEVTPGLTYAAYARAGFFQLVAAVALAIPWLLGVHALLGDRNPGACSVFRAFAGVQLLLLLVIVASAIQRMLAYQAAYGLTELRVVVTAVLAWLTLVVVWLGATVLSGRRDRFMFGGIVTAFVLVGGLQLLNPAGLVVGHNLDRAVELGGVDAEYLSTLGSDAVPVLVARIGELSDEARCQISTEVLRRWTPERPADWKSFNWSERLARDAVAGSLRTLQNLAGPGGCG